MKRRKNRHMRPVLIEESLQTINTDGEIFDIAAHVRLTLSAALTTLEQSALNQTASVSRGQKEVRDVGVPLASEFEN